MQRRSANFYVAEEWFVRISGPAIRQTIELMNMSYDATRITLRGVATL
jgi:hypothetical protein